MAWFAAGVAVAAAVMIWSATWIEKWLDARTKSKNEVKALRSRLRPPAADGPPAPPPVVCSSLRAKECPIHGVCTCPQDDWDVVTKAVTIGVDIGCPLHGYHSTHPRETSSR